VLSAPPVAPAPIRQPLLATFCDGNDHACYIQCFDDHFQDVSVCSRNLLHLIELNRL